MRARRARRGLIVLAVTAALGASTIVPTGAFLTDGAVKAGNTAKAATLTAPTGLTAVNAGTTSGQSTAVSWDSASTLPWAVSNPGTTATYTLERSNVNAFGGSTDSTTVYQGTGTSFTDTTGRSTVDAREATQTVATQRQDGQFALIGGVVYHWGTVTKGETGTTPWVGFDTGALAVVAGFPAEIKQLAAGRDHACGLSVIGKVFCVGFNGFGQVGVNSLAGPTTAAALIDSNNVFTGKVIVQVEAGDYFSCALTSDGTIGCWGDDGYDQLGNAAVSSTALVPVKVSQSGVNGATPTAFATFKPIQIAVGAYHVCALKGPNTDVDGNLSYPTLPITCWGRNNWKQLGSAVAAGVDSTTPTDIADPGGYLTGVTEISAGYTGTCALTNRTSGTNVICWGGGSTGLLGKAGSVDNATPAPITSAQTGLTGLDVGTTSACATRASTIICWGQNDYGQLGVGGARASGTTNYVPATVVDSNSVFAGSAITSISAGWHHACATAASGALACWGDGTKFQLGQGATAADTPNGWSGVPLAVKLGGVPMTTPSGVLGGQAITQISAGGGGPCIVTRIGAAYCWGDEAGGRVGNGFASDTNGIPEQPTPLLLGGALAGKIVSKIYTSLSSSCAITTEKRAYCWGISPGSGVSRALVPVAVDVSGVLAGKDIVDMALDGDDGSVCALTSGGLVACWGHGFYGNVGSYSDSLLPMSRSVGSLAGKTVVDITSTRVSFCALTSDNLIACWGMNDVGELGTGSPSGAINPNTSKPGELDPVFADLSSVPAGEQFSELSSGGGAVCALTTAHHLYCWGILYNGGVVAFDFGLKPSLLSTPGLSNISHLEMTNGGLCALDTGALYCWGFNGVNSEGMLGLGIPSTTTTVSVPTRVNSGYLAGKTVVAMSGATSTTPCALTSDSVMTCWGSNYRGRLGTGSLTPTGTNSPSTIVLGVTTATPLCLESAVQLAPVACSLVPSRVYYYRLSYRISGSNKWVSASVSAPRA